MTSFVLGAIFVYTVITSQWGLMTIAIVLIALVLVGLNALQRIENQAEQSHGTNEQIVTELNSLKELVESVRQDTNDIEQRLERLEERELP